MIKRSYSARAAILNRIRAANAGAEAAARRAEYESIARMYQQSASMDRRAILETFAERLQEYDAAVHEATSANLRATLNKILARYGAKSGITGTGFPEQWLPENTDWTTEANADIADLDAAEMSLVTCEVAIAHTGTLVLRGSRRVTLLPDRLLCAVRESQIVETVPEAIAHLQSFAADALTFISGPSATADIEMTRIRGVHGPRFLDVVVVAD